MIPADHTLAAVRPTVTPPPARPEDPRPEPRWAARARQLARDLRESGAPNDAKRIHAELWFCLGVAMLAFVRRSCGPTCPLSTDEVQDVAWSRTHEVMRRAGERTWDPGEMTPGELAAYIAAVARHAVIDAVRKRSRETSVADWERAVETERGIEPASGRAPETAEAEVQRKEFTRALRSCLARLAPRSRCAWLLRALYDMSSREIADHPDVAVRPDHVDVILPRVRVTLRHCLAQRGFERDDLPRGAFAELWSAFGRGSDPASGALRDGPEAR